MGQIIFSASSIIYVETSPLIYSVEKHVDYSALMIPLWLAMDNDQLEIFSSELSLLETLVAPLKAGDLILAQDYEIFLTATKLQLRAVSAKILREAASLRATTNLKTPDSIHAATALEVGCDQFITNDADFRRVSSLPVVVLKDFIATP